MGWVLGIHSKDQALPAVKAFLKYVQVQYQLEVKGWMLKQPIKQINCLRLSSRQCKPLTRG